MKSSRNTAFRLSVFMASLIVIWTTTVVWAQTQKSAEQARNAPEANSGLKYQPLNIKPGLWERTFILNRTGKLPVPPGMLDSLTPEQRARLQARMDASSGSNTNTSTEKVCITKEQVDNPVKFNDKECTWTILESTRTQAKGKVSCSASGMTMAGTGEFQAPDQEHLRGSAHMTSTGGGNKMTTDAIFTSKWLGSNCGNVR